MKQVLLEDDSTLVRLAALVEACSGALQAGGNVIFAGNGGSFSDTQHRSAEFTSQFRFDRAPFAVVALGTNNSAISAIGNVYDYEQVFASELPRDQRTSRCPHRHLHDWQEPEHHQGRRGREFDRSHRRRVGA